MPSKPKSSRGVTQEKAAEDALRKLNAELEDKVAQRTAQFAEATEQLKSIFDAAGDGISVNRLDGKIIVVNDAFVRLHGYSSKDEIVGRYGLTFIAERDRARLEENARQVIVTGKAAQAEYGLLRREGREFPGEVALSVFKDSQGKPRGMVGITRDLTSQWQAAEVLQTSQVFAKNIIESSLDMIIAVDMDRHITEFNHAAELIFGYRREEVLGKDISLLYANAAEGQAVHEITVGLGQNAQVIMNRKKNGQVFPSLLSASVLRDGQGSPIGLMGISRDITELKRAEEDQDKLLEQVLAGREKLQLLSKRLLEVQENERREIARELHDEIGQAMTSIQMTLQAAEARVADPNVKGQVEDAIHMVEVVLSRVRDLSLNLRPSMLDDFGLLPALSWYFENQSLRTGLDIEFDPAPLTKRPPEQIETVCYRVAQEAITNIVRHARAGHVHVQVKQTDAVLVLNIQDDGVGFSVSEKLTDAVRGSSMGLLGMQERVHLVGGDLKIDSGPGQGTRIRVNLPLGLHQTYSERRSKRRIN